MLHNATARKRNGKMSSSSNLFSLLYPMICICTMFTKQTWANRKILMKMQTVGRMGTPGQENPGVLVLTCEEQTRTSNLENNAIYC